MKRAGLWVTLGVGILASLVTGVAYGMALASHGSPVVGLVLVVILGLLAWAAYTVLLSRGKDVTIRTLLIIIGGMVGLVGLGILLGIIQPDDSPLIDFFMSMGVFREPMTICNLGYDFSGTEPGCDPSR